MKFKMLTTAGAAAAMALAPVAAQAAPMLMAAQATQTTEMADEDDGGMDTGAQVAIVFFLVVVAIAIFASGEGEPASP